MRMFYRIPMVIAFLLSGYSARVFGQIISSVEPSTVYAGQQHAEIIIHGVNTSFMARKTSVDMGPDINVTGISIQNTYTLYAFVNVSASAVTGLHDVTVTTKTNSGNQVAVLQGGITIVSAVGQARATILANPVQAIYLADFNPENIRNSPLLFTVMLYNSNVAQNLTVVVTVSGQRYGLITTATKKVSTMAANAFETIDNRQFDKYTVANTNTQALQSAIQTGKLPSDIYTYQVQVFDATGKPIFTTSASNT